MKANIKLPDYWTPEQATAIFEFVDELRDIILQQYQLQIMEQLKLERSQGFDSDEMFEESDLPF